MNESINLYTYLTDWHKTRRDSIFFSHLRENENTMTLFLEMFQHLWHEIQLSTSFNESTALKHSISKLGSLLQQIMDMLICCLLFTATNNEYIDMLFTIYESNKGNIFSFIVRFEELIINFLNFFIQMGK